MKYLNLLIVSLFLFSCGNPAETASNGITENAAERAAAEDIKIQQDGIKAVEKTVSEVTEVAEEMTEQGEGLLRGTFMYYADAATFIECGTGKRFNVSGDDYLTLEKEYLKQRTKDFEKIYVEIKGEIKMKVGAEGKKKVGTVMVDEMVTMNAAKSCN